MRVLIDKELIGDAQMIECPECGYEVALVGLEGGDFPEFCPGCGVELEPSDEDEE
jgi:hypothetical protein